jgi:hypothetical protein
MQTRLEGLLAQVAEDTFASMTFLLPAELPAGAEDSPGPSRWASVDFAGPFGGRLTLAVPQALVPALAANMLGLEGERPTPLQERDALAELANVICGNLLPIVATPQDVFNVGSPRVAPPDVRPPESEEPPAAAVRVCFEEGCVRLELRISRAEGEPQLSAVAAEGAQP